MSKKALNAELEAWLESENRNKTPKRVSPIAGAGSAPAPLSFPALPVNKTVLIGMPEAPKGEIVVKPNARTLSKEGIPLIQYVAELMDPTSKFYTSAYPILFNDFLVSVVTNPLSKETIKRELRKRFIDLNKAAKNIDVYSSIMLDIFEYLNSTPDANMLKNQLYEMLHPPTNLGRRMAKLKYVSRKARRSTKRRSTRRVSRK